MYTETWQKALKCVNLYAD